MLEALTAVLRTLLYAGLLTCAGVVFAERTLRNAPDFHRFSMQTMRGGALLAIGAALGSALILFFRLGGQWNEATLSAVFISSSGAATCLQLVGAALLLASVDDPSAQGTRLSNAALMTLSFAFNGHAAAADLFDGLIVFAHCAAVAWWIGSLWLLRWTCARVESGVIADVVRRFSAIATRLIGGLVISGLVLILVLVKFNDLPVLSPYEQLLAVKLGIVAVVLGVASYNKFRLTPRLMANDTAAVTSLRQMIDAELILIGVILTTTAILTTYTSPHQ